MCLYERVSPYFDLTSSLKSMDDEECAPIVSGCGSSIDDDQLCYPGYESENVALEALNCLERKTPKRRIHTDDCSPIDWHLRIACSLDEAEKKRRRIENDEKMLECLTKRIKQCRQQKRAVASSSRSRTNEEVVEDASKYSVIFRLPPTDGSSWIGFNSVEGERLYLKLLKSGQEKKLVEREVKRKPKQFLNSQPMELLLSEADQLKTCRLEGNADKDGLIASCAHADHRIESALWVDKYAPKTFTDLLTDDRINRALLKYLKMWDECVFHRPVLDSVETGDRLSDSINMESGRPPRPVQKVVLLSGPAGSGKTTLASVIVRLAGYRVSEMNASDDRNISDFERRIEGAVRSLRTLDSDPRPSCLVVDEVDGAPAVGIKYLCKTVMAKGRSATRRPIICICNNSYVPALRELRSISLVINVPPIEIHRLIKRVELIAIQERVQIEGAAVEELCRMCSCDVRLTINTLQFLAVQSSSLIDIEKLRKYDVKQNLSRDKGLFDAWSVVFDLGRHKSGRGLILSTSERMDQVAAVARQYTGEMDRFHAGLFSNYLSTSSRKLSVNNIYRAAEQFCFFDMEQTTIQITQNFTLNKYLIIVSVSLHLLLASQNVHGKMTFPLAEQNMIQCRKQSTETLDCMLANVQLRCTTRAELILLVLPYLIRIIQPPLKPLTAQLYGGQDYVRIRQVVSLMHLFSLTFKPVISENGVNFVFSPSIDAVVLFPLEERSEYESNVNNAARQMIAREIELDQLRSQENAEKTEINVANDIPLNHFPNIHNGTEEASKITYRYNMHKAAAIRRQIRLRKLIWNWF
ncbi:hypothetical protein AB6A40_001395 [Gnathostoma spinigerum]|uniref:AAA+ ATPase domain-containing protein n=1 Tax=Gnathostoma spinigerum TaxID=75299 RepID=A0ABD6E6B0_9BILA